MTRRHVPRAPAAHGIAGEIHAVVVHAEQALGFGDAAQDVAVGKAHVLHVAAAVRLDVDDALVCPGTRCRSSDGCPPPHQRQYSGFAGLKPCIWMTIGHFFAGS